LTNTSLSPAKSAQASLGASAALASSGERLDRQQHGKGEAAAAYVPKTPMVRGSRWPRQIAIDATLGPRRGEGVAGGLR